MKLQLFLSQTLLGMQVVFGNLTEGSPGPGAILQLLFPQGRIQTPNQLEIHFSSVFVHWQFGLLEEFLLFVKGKKFL